MVKAGGESLNTYAPVVSWITVRLMLIFALILILKLVRSISQMHLHKLISKNQYIWNCLPILLPRETIVFYNFIKVYTDKLKRPNWGTKKFEMEWNLGDSHVARTRIRAFSYPKQ